MKATKLDAFPNLLSEFIFPGQPFCVVCAVMKLTAVARTRTRQRVMWRIHLCPILAQEKRVISDSVSLPVENFADS